MRHLVLKFLSAVIAAVLSGFVWGSDVVEAWLNEEVSGYTELASSLWALPEYGEAQLVGEENAKMINLATEYGDALIYSIVAPSVTSKVVNATVKLKPVIGDVDPISSPDSVAGVSGVGMMVSYDESENVVWYVHTGDGWKALSGPQIEDGTNIEVRVEIGNPNDGSSQVRYAVKLADADGYVVLKDESGNEWFSSPLTDADMAVSSINFAGEGKIGDFALAQVLAKVDGAEPVIAAGFNWSGSTVTLDIGDSYVIDGETPVQLELTVKDAAGNQVGTVYTAKVDADGKAEFEVEGLTPGANYTFEATAKNGAQAIGGFSQAGELVMSEIVGGDNSWIATYYDTEEYVEGGVWNPALVWSDGKAVINATNDFVLDEEKVSEADGAYTYIENIVCFNDFLNEEDFEAYDISGAQGALTVGIDDNNIASWRGYVASGWRQLVSNEEPEPEAAYVTRIELDYTQPRARVRYSVKKLESEAAFEVLKDENDNEWFEIAAEATAPQKVTLLGYGDFYQLQGRYVNYAVAQVGDTRYDSFLDALIAANALIAAKQKSADVKLLTNVRYAPGGLEGSWTIVTNDYAFVLDDPTTGFAGAYTSEDGALVINRTMSLPIRNETLGLDHATLADAVAMAKAGNELSMQSDCAVSNETAMAFNSLVINLNGCALTGAVEMVDAILAVTNGATVTITNAGEIGELEVWAGSKVAFGEAFAPTEAVEVGFKGEWEHGAVMLEGVTSEIKEKLVLLGEKDIQAPGLFGYDEEEDTIFWAEIPPEYTLELKLSDGYDGTNVLVSVDVTKDKGDIKSLKVEFFDENGESLWVSNIACTVAGSYEFGAPAVVVGRDYEICVTALGGDNGDLVVAGGGAYWYRGGVGGDPWFRAQADEIINGEWVNAPEQKDDKYVLEGDDYSFAPGDDPALPTNAAAMVTMVANFTSGADLDGALMENGQAGFTLAVGEQSGLVWKGSAGAEWFVLTNGIAAATGEYTIMTEFDYASATPRVSFAMLVDGRIRRFADESGNIWFALADQAAVRLDTVVVSGEGTLSQLEGTFYRNAIVEIDGVGYDSVAAAAVVAKDNEDKEIKLLTNVSWNPDPDKDAGTYHFDYNGFAISASDIVEWSQDDPSSDKWIATVGEAYVPFTPEDSEVEVLVRTKWLDDQGIEKLEDLMNTGANGLTYLESYVLGLDPKDEASKPVIVDQLGTATESIHIFMGNVDLRKDAGVDVFFKLVDGNGNPIVDGNGNPIGERNTTGEFDAPLPVTGSPVLYYQVKIEIGQKETSAAD